MPIYAENACWFIVFNRRLSTNVLFVHYTEKIRKSATIIITPEQDYYYYFRPNFDIIV